MDESMSYAAIAPCGHCHGITCATGSHLAKALAQWVRAGCSIEHWPKQKALDAFDEGMFCHCDKKRKAAAAQQAMPL